MSEGDRPGYEPSAGRARAATFALAANVALDALLCVRFALALYLDGHGFPDWFPTAGLDLYDDFWDLEDLARRLSVFVTAIVFLAWWHRIARNGIALAATPPTYTPGSAVGMWFVPLLNLFVPYQLARQIEAASGGKDDPRIAAWWAADIGRGVVWGLGSRVLTGSGLPTLFVYYLVATATTAGAAWLCVSVIRYFERLQREAAIGPEALAEIFA